MALDCNAAAATFGRVRSDHIEEYILLLDVICLGLASLPAVSPALDQPPETQCINSHAWLEANAQVAVVHLVFVGVSQEKRKVAGNSKEKIVVEWREIRELINEHLRDCIGGTVMCLSDTILGSLGEQLVRKFTEPSLQHGADDVDIVEITLLKKVDVTLCSSISKISLISKAVSHLRQNVFAIS